MNIFARTKYKGTELILKKVRYFMEIYHLNLHFFLLVLNVYSS
jgi:hypothetical protein